MHLWGQNTDWKSLGLRGKLEYRQARGNSSRKEGDLSSSSCVNLLTQEEQTRKVSGPVLADLYLFF